MFDPEQAMAPGAPVIHDKGPDARILDPKRNIVWKVEGGIGDVAAGFAEADAIHEGTYYVPRVQHAHLETLSAIGWTDAQGRLNIRSSTQVPFLTRKELARVFDLDLAKLRVFCERVGGGFGAKQEMMVEDIVALAALKTGRPVKLEFTRPEQFIAATTRHPMRVKVKIGAKRDGTLTAIEMHVLSNVQHRRLRQSRRAGARTCLFGIDQRLSLRQQEGRGLRGLHQHGAGWRLSRLRPAADRLCGRIRDRRRSRAPSAWTHSNSAAATWCARATR